MEQWYEELDFEENPFNTNPSNFLKNVVGREDVLDELIYRVKAGSIVFLEGNEGMGKTTMLKLLIKKFMGKGKVIYVNSEKLEKDLNIEDLLVNGNGLVKGMILKQYPKNMILLLDNVSELSKLNSERIKYFFDEGFLKSVIFTGESFEKAEFSGSLKQRTAKVIKLEPLEEYQAVDMIRERIGDIKFFSDEVIELISEYSLYNPKKILENSEEVAEYVIGIDEDVATLEHVKQALGKKPESTKDSSSKTESEEVFEDISEEFLVDSNEDSGCESGCCSDDSCESCASECASEDEDVLEEAVEFDSELESEDEPKVKEVKAVKVSKKDKSSKKVAEYTEDDELDLDEDFSDDIKEIEDIESEKIESSDLEDDSDILLEDTEPVKEAKSKKKKDDAEYDEELFDDEDSSEETDDFFDDELDDDLEDESEDSGSKNKKWKDGDDDYE